jgi:hypothetical protein
MDLWREQCLEAIEKRVVERFCASLFSQPTVVRSQRYRPALQTVRYTALDTLDRKILGTLAQQIHGYRDQLRESARLADAHLRSTRSRRKGKRDQSSLDQRSNKPLSPSHARFSEFLAKKVDKYIERKSMLPSEEDDGDDWTRPDPQLTSGPEAPQPPSKSSPKPRPRPDPSRFAWE